MATITVDMYKVASQLKSHGFSEEQAAGVTQAIQEINLEHVVTKADLSEFKAELYKFLIGAFLGQAALITALLKLLGH